MTPEPIFPSLDPDSLLEVTGGGGPWRLELAKRGLALFGRGEGLQAAYDAGVKSYYTTWEGPQLTALRNATGSLINRWAFKLGRRLEQHI